MEEKKEAMNSKINKESIESSEDVKIGAMTVSTQENSSSYTVACSQSNLIIIADTKIEERYK